LCIQELLLRTMATADQQQRQSAGACGCRAKRLQVFHKQRRRCLDALVRRLQATREVRSQRP